MSNKAKTIKDLKAQIKAMRQDSMGNVSLSGVMAMTIRRADGTIRDHVVKNTVMTVGKTHVAELMANTAATEMGYMDLGESNTDAGNAGRTTLVAPLTGARKALTAAKSVSGTACIYVCTWPDSEGEGSLQEAGIFDQSGTGGTMLCRTTFDTKTKQAGDTLQITWTITVA